MCGIAGKLNFNNEPVSESLMTAMADAMRHRGPDENGVYVKGSIGFSHRRLSIIDLASGQQPMCNEDHSIWITFNGEIYNFVELRELLLKKGHVFRTDSDTEAIVHLYEEFGVDCLQYLNGMFAFAVWDEKRRRLFMARDRLGKKPLVYALKDQSITFASEIGAILQDKTITRDIDAQALDLYLKLLYVPAPWTMVKAVRKLPPAHYLLWEDGQVQIERYWQLDFEPNLDLTEEDAIAEIRALLEDSVRCRLVSDVPLGAFLSGGIDSSTIVALMTKLTGRPVRTFSIGFGDDIRDELPYAREVAERYGTDHTDLRVDPQMVDVLPQLVRHYGEPYGDHSAVATYWLSKLTRESVTVALSGDGGDEVFGGYPWYVEAPRHRELAASYLRDGLVSLQSGWEQRQVQSMLGAVKGTAVGLDTVFRGWHDPRKAYERLVTFYNARQRQNLYSPDVLQALALKPAPDLFHTMFQQTNGNSLLNQMFYADHHLYLPDDILVKVDIASMAHSLEVRSPFLDYRLVEFAATLPPAMKVDGDDTKRILRQAVTDIVPSSVINRPKSGFGLPINMWLRNDLYGMAQDLLLDRSSYIRDYFNVGYVANMLADHRANKQRYGEHLWLLLFFEVWCQNFLSKG